MIAFLGQGRMGVPMARRLAAAGHDVTTWRRGTGVTAAAAVEGADLVITMLSDPAAVREVLTAALPGLRPGTTVVEMSTIGPEAVRLSLHDATTAKPYAPNEAQVLIENGAYGSRGIN
ncbi:NAD(P)-binding domain-containing protein, partial [Nonomuraea wenchangensis]